MAHWRMIVTLAGATFLVVGTALAQHQILPPNRPEKQTPPNAPVPGASHWGPPLEDPDQEAPKRKSPSDTRSKPRGYSTTHKGEAQDKSPSSLPTDAAEEQTVRPARDQ